MEIYNILGTAGFLLSTIVLVMLSLFFVQYSISIEISPFFILIVPLFVAGIMLRGVAWMEFGKAAMKRFYFITGGAVIILGVLMVYAFSGLLQYAVNIPSLSNLAHIINVIAILALWLAYSTMEFLSLKRIFKDGFLRLSTFNILGAVLVVISLLYLDNYTVYILAAAFAVCAIGTFLAAIGFLSLETTKRKSVFRTLY